MTAARRPPGRDAAAVHGSGRQAAELRDRRAVGPLDRRAGGGGHAGPGPEGARQGRLEHAFQGRRAPGRRRLHRQPAPGRHDQQHARAPEHRAGRDRLFHQAERPALPGRRHPEEPRLRRHPARPGRQRTRGALRGPSGLEDRRSAAPGRAGLQHDPGGPRRPTGRARPTPCAVRGRPTPSACPIRRRAGCR